MISHIKPMPVSSLYDKIFYFNNINIFFRLVLTGFCSVMVAGFSCGQSRNFQLPYGITEKDYDPHTIVVKLKSSPVNGRTDQPGIEQLFAMINGKKFRKAISGFTRYGQKSAYSRIDLSEIYKITIGDKENLEAKINQLLAHENVAYAEPYYLPKPLFIPNDPSASSGGDQTYLSIIHAYEAWEFEKGDSTVVIGILDTGVDLTHEDLADNIFYNQNDPINGIDDDGDGYIDNYQGWDFANNDNDPTADFDQHGTSVAGVSSARTNNGKGIAGVGFKSKFLPIKIFDTENNVFNNGYEAILYAAEQGCKIVNLSWGSVNTFSNFAQDIINFAVLDMDVVVVAAAGNTNADLHFYPASYDNVLSVGASNNNDEKAGFATYSHFIDVMAPGAQEYTTKNGGGYGNATGSSFASPMVAGIAALVRARYPDLNARQVMEKIRMTTDNIYDIPGNDSYFEQLGRGRINAQSAIAPSNKPAVRMTNLVYTNSVGRYAASGDTVSITMDFINILNTTANAIATLSCPSPFVTIIEGNFNIGSLTTMEEKSNANSPFVIYLDPDLPVNTILSFRLGYEDVNYSDYQYFELVANPDHINLDNGKISLTVASNGNLAYVDSNLSNGSGLVFKGKKLLDHIGIAFGAEPTKVVDNIIFDLNTGEKNSDFDNVKPLQFIGNSIAPIDARSTFADTGASDPISLQITQKLLSTDADSANSFVVIEYRVTNLSGSDLGALYTGIYADWDIGQYTNNMAEWDQTRRLGYIYNANENNQFTGIALITGQEAIYNAINLANENGNTADYSGTLTKSDKHNLLTASAKEVAGELGAGNDVAQFLSGKELDLKNNHSTKIAFVIAVEESLASLQNTIVTATDFYADYLQNPPVSEIFNICRDESVDINPSAGVSYRFYADADTTQLLGQGAFYTTGLLTEDQSYYIVNTDEAFKGDIEQVRVVIKDPEVDFLVNPDTVFIDESHQTAVQFTDLTMEAISWDWDFGNGFFGDTQHPVIDFVNEGIYNVRLKAETVTGCVDSLDRQMVVVTRGPKPDIGNFQICPGEPVILQATNATNIRLYPDESLASPLHEGNSIMVENLREDTTIYVTNRDSTYESLPTKISIDVSEINADFNFFIDSMQLNETVGLIFNSLSADAITWEWHIDQNLISNNQQFIMLPSENKNIIVTLITHNGQGCQDSTGQVISFKKSPQPQTEHFRFCAGGEVTIDLQNGGFYNFYEDEGLTNLMGKGSSIILDNLAASKTIYYTNLDSLLESESNTIEVEIIDTFAHFKLDSETIFLDQEHEIALSDLSLSVVDRKWYLDDKLISSDSSFLQHFDASGNYMIKLLAENDIGCIDSLEKTLKVLLVTGLDEFSEQKEIFVYPNPAAGTVFINTKGLTEKTYDLQVFDKLGNAVLEKKYTLSDIKGGINLQNLHPGVYYLGLYSKNSGYSTKKLILR